MDIREEGLVTIYNRIYTVRSSIGLKAFRRTPTKPINDKYLPCIFMHEGIDEIVEHSTRNQYGYPCKRALEVILEIVSDKDTNIKQLYRDVRSAVFDGGVIVADDNAFIREIRTEGPTGYGLPNVTSIDFVLLYQYTDTGIF